MRGIHYHSTLMLSVLSSMRGLGVGGLVLVLAAGLTGCGGGPLGGRTCTVELSVDDSVVGECGQICGAVSIDGKKLDTAELLFVDERSGEVEGEALTLSLDANEAEFCWEGPLPVGDLVLRVETDHCSTETSVSVSGFGASYGLPREAPLTSIPWEPTVEGLEDEPFFTPAESGWDSLSVMAPTVVTFQGAEWLYYAGNQVEDFSVGVARREAGETEFSRVLESPILKPGSAVEEDWKRFAQNTPEALVVGDEIWLYYSGRREFDSGLGVGLAKSSDGLVFTDAPENPLLAQVPDGEFFDRAGIAHPSVIHRGDAFQLWFATGDHEIGYALSDDGANFDRYCGNPVFEGVGEDSWDEDVVKAPEVVFDGEQYWMTYSGGGRGQYQVGWAVSADGIDWLAAEAPILPAADDASWNAVATQEAFIVVEEDTWRFWYAGNSGTEQQIGVVEAVRP